MNVNDIVTELEDTQRGDHDKRENARECESFCEKKDGQWEQRIWDKFKGRPRYTFDKVNHIVDLICSSIESKSFGIKLSPASAKTPSSLADAVSGIIRSMQYKDKADDIYNRAMRRCIKTGFDAWRVNTRWKKGEFVQEPCIDYIANSLDKVWFDKNSVEPDASDAMYCWVMAEMTTDKFKSEWPKAAISPLGSDRQFSEYWYKNDKIMVGEYLYSMPVDVQMCRLSSGEIITDENPNYDILKSKDAAMYGGKGQRSRVEVRHKWYSRKFTASEWLEEPQPTVFKSCPVIPVYGNFDVSDGKVIYRGVVERLMDAQRVLNYAKSREIEEGALQPRRMWWMTKKAAGDAKNIERLREMNTSASPVQFYEADPDAPPPFQAGTNEINPHLANLSASMAQDIEATAGKYGVSLGKNTQMQSGVALDIQNNQASLGDIKWEQVLARSIKRTADVLVEIIPSIMDTHQEVQAMTESMGQSVIEINKPVMGDNSQLEIENDVTKSNFSVVVDITDSFSTRQKETVAGLLQVAQIKPDILDRGADILFDNLNFPGIKDISKRYRADLLMSGGIPVDQMTEDEKEQMQQAANQPPAPDPNMLIAQAEMMKAEADMLAQQNRRVELQIRMGELERKSYETTIAEAEAAADIDNTNADTIKKMAEAEQISGQTAGQQIDNMQKVMPQMQGLIIQR